MFSKHAAHVLAVVLVALLLATFAAVVISRGTTAATDQPPKGWNWVCFSAQRDYVDPIAFRGVYPTHHKHDIFGSTLKPYTTALRLATQDNNCKWAHNPEDEGDKSVMWEPVPYYRDTGEEIRTSQVNVYYRMPKGVEPSEVRPPVQGWRYILGSAAAEGAQEHIQWRCPHVPGSAQGTPIDCTPYGEKVKISYFLPSCSDGHKDSLNHQDHAVYPDKNGCPASHPRAIPAINLSFGIKTMDGTGVVFRDSDGASIAPHADYENGTPRGVWLKWLDLCMDSEVGGCAGTGIPGQKNP